MTVTPYIPLVLLVLEEPLLSSIRPGIELSVGADYHLAGNSYPFYFINLVDPIEKCHATYIPSYMISVKARPIL